MIYGGLAVSATRGMTKQSTDAEQAEAEARLQQLSAKNQACGRAGCTTNRCVGNHFLH